MYALAQDLRFAFRQLRKSPGSSLAVVVMLALGMGATTAIFSLVEGVLLRPLPFANPDRLVLLGDHVRRGGSNLPVTAREIGTYSSSAGAFSSMGGYASVNFEVSSGAIPEQISAARLTAEVFSTLGVQPLLGRVFTQQEENAHHPLTVISYALWLNRYQLDPHVLGTTIVLSRSPYTIIGVMPRSFEFPLSTGRGSEAQLWVPMSLTADELSDENAGYWGYQMVARLKDGVTAAQAAKDADRVAQEIMRNFPVSQSAIHIQGDVSPLRERLVADVRPLLRILFAAVAVVLLIACANVSGLLLVRAIRRRREHAVRLALGAGSAGIIREAVLEGLLLSVPGGLLGLAFATIGIRTALHLLPDSMPRLDSISMDAPVVIFGLAIAVATGILCSVAPAFAAMRTNLIEALKESGRTGAAAGHPWLRSALVIGEVGVALVLLTVSGAFLRSFQKMRAVDLGFRPDHVLVASYQLPLNQYSTNNLVTNFNRTVMDRLSNKPAVTAAGLTSVLPASGFSAMASYTIEDVPVDKWKMQFAQFAITDGDYFKALNVPLLDGRTFTPDDRPDSIPVVIVNESMAQHSWPGQRAVGKRMHIGNPQKPYPWATVVGVVADTRINARDEPSDDQIYIPAQQPAVFSGAAASGRLTNASGGFIVLRSDLPPEQMTQTLRASVAEVDPLLALQQVEPMDDVISNVEAPRRFNTDLITIFALGALLLAVTGIYAVVAFSVSLRTQEIAVRMALGAQRSGIARLVLISGAKMALAGCALGVLGSLAVSRLVSSFLFNVSATDPAIYATAALLMMLTALVASLLPATRAASADPVDALRTS
jgi:predicted permease